MAKAQYLRAKYSADVQLKPGGVCEVYDVPETNADDDSEAKVDEVQHPEWGGIVSVSISIGIHWIILY